MFKEFATVYRDNNNKIHLYVFPGIDNNGKQLYRNMDLNNINAEYKFTKNEDKSYDFVFENKNITKLTCTMIHVKTNNIKKFIFENI